MAPSLLLLLMSAICEELCLNALYKRPLHLELRTPTCLCTSVTRLQSEKSLPNKVTLERESVMYDHLLQLATSTAHAESAWRDMQR
jgi:hypothetical protein